MGLVDSTGVGAWICIDMARVGRARSGTRPRLMERMRGEAVGEELEACVLIWTRLRSAYDRECGEVRRGNTREREEVLR